MNQASDFINDLERLIAAKAVDYNIPSVSVFGVEYGNGGLGAFAFRVDHPNFANTAASELGKLLYDELYQVIGRLPGSEIIERENDQVIVIPGPRQGVPFFAGEGMPTTHTFSGSVTNSNEASQVAALNGMMFIMDFLECSDIVVEVPWSDYYIKVHKTDIWFCARYSKVKYEKLPPRSEHNGSNGYRMLLKTV